MVILAPGPWISVLEFLCAKFPQLPGTVWQQRLAAGNVTSDSGEVFQQDSIYPGKGKLYYYRALADEPRIPFQAQIIAEHEHFLIVDKPHFLPVVPAGKYLQETLLVRLKKQLELSDLVPAHRIDQDTAGLVLITKTPAMRDAYQALFRNHMIRKTYQAVVHCKPDSVWPARYLSHLRTSAEFMVMETCHELPANAETCIALINRTQSHARLRLTPKTGLRHQLRAQLCALGTPIVFDRIYPTFLPEIAAHDHEALSQRYTQPMQLLAESLAFVDPLTGLNLEFRTNNQLLPLI